METKKKNELKQLLLDLIAIDTTKETKEAAMVIKSFLTDRGIKVQLQPVKPGDVNVLASIKPEKVTSNRKIVLSGHLDVVPPGDPTSWKKCHPFEPREDGDLIYGRGSADMKGGVVAIIGALLELSNHKDLGREIMVLCTADEEGGMLGSKTYIADHAPEDVDVYVIAEPTSLNLGISEKAILWLELLLKGKSAHGSRPDLGRNAIKMTTRALETIETMLPTDEHALLGTSTMNTGTILGGTKINVVPDECKAEVDFRLIPGVDSSSFVESINKALTTELGQESFKTTVTFELPAIEAPINHPFISCFEKVTNELLGKRKYLGLSYATDGAILSSFNNTPFLIFGPGDPSVIHAPDEFTDFKEVTKASQCLVETIKRHCFKTNE
ncbi:MAG: M20 family metallopeptidase [Candidatus Hodarchaeales archaeon]